MKRILPALLTGLFVISLSTACSDLNKSKITTEAPELRVLEIEVLSDSSDGGEYVSELGSDSDARRKSYQDKDAPGEAKVVLNGKTYTGEYTHSIVEGHYFHVSDYYSGSSGWFSVNRETAQLERLHPDSSKKGDKSTDECRKIAEELARQYIDLSQYTLSGGGGDNLHPYLFMKTINGMETNDTLFIGVSSSGEIVDFSNFTSGNAENAFNSIDAKAIDDLIERLSSSEVMEMIDKKVNTIYEDCASYSIENKVLVDLENNELGLIYVITGKFTPIQIEEGYMVSWFITELLVYES